jgi:LysM repeat protein
MNLKDIADKLASLEKLEKLPAQMDKKVPGQQMTSQGQAPMDPKADVNAMQQALSALRTAPIQPQAQTVAPSNTSQQAPAPTPAGAEPAERPDMQQKNKPGEPTAEDAVAEERVDRQKYIEQVMARVNDDPAFVWEVDERVRDQVMSSMTPAQRNIAKLTANAAQASAMGDKESADKFTQQLTAAKEKLKTAAPAPKADTASDIETQTRIAQSLGTQFALEKDPVKKAELQQKYTDAALKLKSLENPKGQTNTEVEPAASKPAAKKPGVAAQSGDWFKGKEGDYTIQSGDTLSGISKKTGIPMSQLMKMNDIQNPNKILAGAKLKTGQAPAAATDKGAAFNLDNAPKGVDVDDFVAGTAGQPEVPGAFKFSPEQEKFLGNANRQDPDILSKMPGPKPTLDYFKNPEDRARAKELNYGQQNLNSLKKLAGMKPTQADIFTQTQTDNPQNATQAAQDDEIGAIVAQNDEQKRNAELQAELDKQNAGTNKSEPPVANPNVTDRKTSTTTDNAGRTTTNTSAMLTGISQQQLMKHPAYIAYMNDPKNANQLAKNPQIARDIASMQARVAIAKDPTSVPPSDDQLRRAASSTDADAAASARNVIAQQQKDATEKVPAKPVPMPAAPSGQNNTAEPKPVAMPAPSGQNNATGPKPVAMPAPPTATPQVRNIYPQRHVPGEAPEAPENETLQLASKNAAKENIFSLNSIVDEILNRK